VPSHRSFEAYDDVLIRRLFGDGLRAFLATCAQIFEFIRG